MKLVIPKSRLRNSRQIQNSTQKKGGHFGGNTIALRHQMGSIKQPKKLLFVLAYDSIGKDFGTIRSCLYIMYKLDDHASADAPPSSMSVSQYGISSLVDIAERPINRTHERAHRVHLLIDVCYVNIVGQLGKSTSTEHVGLARNDLHAICQVLRLPDIPDAVDHAVQQPEGRVAGRVVEVATRVRADGEVCRAVHTRAALQRVLEGADGFGAGDQSGDYGCCCVSGGQIGAEVAA